MNQTGDKKIPASPEEWLQHALSDLKFAKLGYESSDILFQQICFHAQQAVEKAILIAEKITSWAKIYIGLNKK